jgi:hypothetical protein
VWLIGLYAIISLCVVLVTIATRLRNQVAAAQAQWPFAESNLARGESMDCDEISE